MPMADLVVKVAARELKRAVSAKSIGNDAYAAGRLWQACAAYSDALALAPPS